MGTVIKELVTQGHELVALLGTQHGMHDAASLVQRLTAQLDITAVALREMTRKRDAEHGDVLTWEKTMFRVCGEDGHKSVAAKFAELEAKCVALAAENAGLKTFGDKLSEMHNDLNGEGTGIQGRAEVACQQVALEAAMEEFDAIKTPATDAFLAEVRAQGVGMFAASLKVAGICEHPYLDAAIDLAAKLRQDANSAMLQGAVPVTDNTNQQFESLSRGDK